MKKGEKKLNPYDKYEGNIKHVLKTIKKESKKANDTDVTGLAYLNGECWKYNESSSIIKFKTRLE